MPFPTRNLSLALSILAALAVLIAAWVLPLPRLVLSDEEQAAVRMPETRSGVSAASASMSEAEQIYEGYVASHDVGGALDALDAALTRQASGTTDTEEIKERSQEVLAYLAQLQTFAQVGEQYFAVLTNYDDELMAWTRSLGTASERLRPDTWPIVEYLKLYPPPVGLNEEYTDIKAADLDRLKKPLDDARVTGVLAADAFAVADVREAGRSMEYILSLHAQYASLLGNYDTKLQAVALGRAGGTPSSSRVALATGLNLAVAGALVLGLAALFLRRHNNGEAAP